MRRIAFFGVPVGVGVLVARGRGARLHQWLVAHCETMFGRMPDTFPPKRMLRSVEEIRVHTNRILELLEADRREADKRRPPGGASGEAVHHAA